MQKEDKKKGKQEVKTGRLMEFDTDWLLVTEVCFSHRHLSSVVVCVFLSLLQARYSLMLRLGRSYSSSRWNRTLKRSTKLFSGSKRKRIAQRISVLSWHRKSNVSISSWRYGWEYTTSAARMQSKLCVARGKRCFTSGPQVSSVTQRRRQVF